MSNIEETIPKDVVDLFYDYLITSSQENVYYYGEDPSLWRLIPVNDNSLAYACLYNYTPLIHYLLKQLKQQNIPYNIDKVLIYCIKGNNIEFLTFFLSQEQEKDYSFLLTEAIIQNNFEIIKLLIQDLKSKNKFFSNRVIDTAIDINRNVDNLNIIDYLITNYTINNDELPYDFTYGLYSATITGNLNIIKYFINKLKELNKEIPWMGALDGAINGGNLEVVYYLIEQIMLNNPNVNWNSSLSSAVGTENIELINLFINLSRQQDTPIDWEKCLESATFTENMSLITFCIQQARQDGVILNYNNALITAAQNGNLRFVRLFVELGATQFIRAAIHADMMRHREIVNFFIENNLVNPVDLTLQQFEEVDDSEFEDEELGSEVESE